MAYSDFRPMLHCFWILSLLFAWASGMTDQSGIIPVKDYFPEVGSDLTKVTWAHAVNSRAELDAALKGPLMMLEADILMGKKGGTGDKIPIMAHPPNETSDLSFDDFLSAVVKAVKDGKRRKGIKLDFKDLSAVSPVLKALKKKLEEKVAGFPVWVNADILKGPVNSTRKPLDASKFLKKCLDYLPNATLSLGWTTRFGHDDPEEVISVGHYEKEHIDMMLKALSERSLDERTEITFPVRAGMAAQSIDKIMTLIGGAGPSKSLTIWSHPLDPVDMDSLRNLITQVGQDRCYVDVPFSMETGPSANPTPKPTKRPEEDPDHVHNSTCDHDSKDDSPEVNSSSLTSSSFLFLSSLFVIGLLIMLI